MKKTFFIISLILVIILSSFSFTFAAEPFYPNLLNLTFDTSTTLSGITCTVVGDGTFTFDGVASSNRWFTLADHVPLSGGTYKVIGVKSSSSVSRCYAIFFDSLGNNISGDVLANSTFSSSDIASVSFVVAFYTGFPASNVIVKPMITENLSATYDDFVPYGYEPPKPSIIGELIQPLVGLLGSARSGISSFFEFVTNAFHDVYSIPAVFPSLWALVPSSITSVYLGIFVIVTFMGIIKFLLSK